MGEYKKITAYRKSRIKGAMRNSVKKLIEFDYGLPMKTERILTHRFLLKTPATSYIKKWTRFISKVRFAKGIKVIPGDFFCGVFRQILVKDNKKLSLILDTKSVSGYYFGFAFWEFWDFESDPVRFHVNNTDGVKRYAKKYFKTK